MHGVVGRVGLEPTTKGASAAQCKARASPLRVPQAPRGLGKVSTHELVGRVGLEPTTKGL